MKGREGKERGGEGREGKGREEYTSSDRGHCSAWTKIPQGQSNSFKRREGQGKAPTVVGDMKPVVWRVAYIGSLKRADRKGDRRGGGYIFAI